MFPLSLSSVSVPTGVVVTEEMLQPVVDGFSSNVAVALPICLLGFAVITGVCFLPRLFKKFFAK